MKRIGLFLLLAFLMLAIVGCGGDDDDDDDRKDSDSKNKSESSLQEDADAIYSILSSAETVWADPSRGLAYGNTVFTVIMKNGNVMFDYTGGTDSTRESDTEEWNRIAKTEDSEYSIKSKELKSTSITFTGKEQDGRIVWTATGDLDALMGYNNNLSKILSDSKNGTANTESPTPEATNTPTEIPYVDVDPFELVDVEFKGYSPQMQPECVLNDKAKQIDGASSIRYEFAQQEHLRIGDTVKLTASISESYAKQYHIRLTAEEKEYTVTGDRFYIEKFEDIPEKALEEMTESVKNKVTAKYASTQMELVSTEYYGTYVVSAKHPEQLESYIVESTTNMVWVIVKAHVKGKKGTEADVYFCGYWNNFAKIGDKEWNLSIDADMQCRDQEHDGGLDGAWFIYGSYEEDYIYKKYILAFADQYNIASDLANEE